MPEKFLLNERQSQRLTETSCIRLSNLCFSVMVTRREQREAHLQKSQDLLPDQECLVA